MTYTPDDLSGILSAAELTLGKARQMVTQELHPADYEVQRDECTDMASTVSSVVDDYDSQMDELKQKKRDLDKQITDIVRIQRPYKALKTDLREFAKRLNNQFWSAKRDLQNRNLS